MNMRESGGGKVSSIWIGGKVGEVKYPVWIGGKVGEVKYPVYE